MRYLPGLIGLILIGAILGIGQQAEKSDIDHAIDSTPKTFDVVVDTDLGGDPDDIQSLFRLIHYSDILHVKAIIATPNTHLKQHPWDTIPRVRLIREWIQRADVEHLRTRGHTELMAESELLASVSLGSTHPGAPNAAKSSEGARRLIRIARNYDATDPLWVLVWGSITTLAQALFEAPEIAPNIRIYYISSSNTQHDPEAREFVFDFMRSQYPDLWWIENGALPKWSHETFRGVYQGGLQDGEWGMTTFIDTNIRGHGSTNDGMFAEKCGDVFPTANWPANSLKEGDSPSILYLISPVLSGKGNPEDPTQESWGGTFRRMNPLRFPNYYVDLDLPPEACQATINKWRLDYLGDWKRRWDWYRED